MTYKHLFDNKAERVKLMCFLLPIINSGVVFLKKIVDFI